jgi:hypothetical protein
VPTRISPRRVFLFVESERRLRTSHQDRTPDQIRLLHHQVDRFLLRLRQRPLLEYRASRAHEVEEPIFLDVLFQEGAIGRIAVDVALFDLDAVLLQITSGVAAGRSRRLPEEGRLRHALILSCRPSAGLK